MSDCYDGQDLLADVFEGTEDAPDPAPVIDCGGSLIKLWANPADPRWSVDMSRWPNGDVMVVRSIRRTQANGEALSGPVSVQGSPSTRQGGLVAPTATVRPGNGIQESML